MAPNSDPSTSALIGAFCELGRHPDQAEKIYQEVAQVDDVNDVQALKKLPHLRAVINETMRLYPTLLAWGSRKTTSKGITIAGRYIPPHTTIINPRYTIGRRKFIRSFWYSSSTDSSKPGQERTASRSLRSLFRSGGLLGRR